MREFSQRILSDLDIYETAKNPTSEQILGLAFEGVLQRALLKGENPPASLSEEDQLWATGQFAQFTKLYDYLAGIGGQEAQLRQRLIWNFPDKSEQDWESLVPIMEAQKELEFIRESIIRAGIINQPPTFAEMLREEEPDRMAQVLQTLGSIPPYLREKGGAFKKRFLQTIESLWWAEPREIEPPKDELIEESERRMKSLRRSRLLQLPERLSNSLERFPKKEAAVIGSVLVAYLLVTHSGLDIPYITMSGQPPKPEETLATSIPEDLKTGTEVIFEPIIPSVEDFLSKPIAIKEGEWLYKVLREQANSFGVGWINPENGITKGDVVADLVSAFLRKRGIDPDQMQPGQTFSWDDILNSEERKLIKDVLDTQSADDYKDNVALATTEPIHVSELP